MILKVVEKAIISLIRSLNLPELGLEVVVTNFTIFLGFLILIIFILDFSLVSLIFLDFRLFLVKLGFSSLFKDLINLLKK